MMLLIVVLCVAAVIIFFKTYKKEMREKAERENKPAAKQTAIGGAKCRILTCS